MKIEKLINQHPSFFDDLRIASGLLESRRPIIAAALAEYADALAEYDDDNPSFVVKTANEWIEEASKRPEPWEGEWKITPEGDLEHAKFDYFIESYRLGTENWLEHMAGKTWVNLNTFVPAYLEACHRAGITSVKIVY